MVQSGTSLTPQGASAGFPQRRALSCALAVAASALFWAWYYLCFGTVLAYGAPSDLGASAGADVVFLVSQFALLAAVLLPWVSGATRTASPQAGDRGFLSRRTVAVSAAVLALYTVLRGLLDPGPVVQTVVLVVASVVAGGAVLPVAAVALWAWGGSLRSAQPDAAEGAPGNEMTDGEPSLQSLPWSLLLAFAVTCLLGEVVSFLATTNVEDGGPGPLVAGTAANVLFCLGVMLAGWRSRGSLRVGDAFFVVGPLMVVVLLLQATQAGLDPAVSQLLHSGTLMLQVTLWTLLAHLVEREGLSPQPVFGAGLFVLSAVMGAAHVLDQLLARVFEVAPDSAAAVSVAVLACVLSALAFWRGRPAAVGESGEPGGSEAARTPAAAGAFDDAREVWEAAVGRKVDAFAAATGLSPRETQVFACLLTGTTAPRIGEELGLTTGTVKTHVAHIYRKLGVNTRQQAVDAFDAF